jgi:hypothetical protein
VKHNFFAKVFDRPVFKGTYEKVVRYRNGRVRADINGKTTTECLPRAKDGPNPAFTKKHKLSTISHPANFGDVFMPYKTK